MITRTPGSRTSEPAPIPNLGSNAAPLWQRELTRAVRSLDELLEILELTAEEVSASDIARREFPLLVPRGFVDRMRPGDPRDPLLLQVLPTAEEERAPAGFVADPLAESQVAAAPGLLHKYRGRALLVTTGACAVHCRYCFRRHFPYEEHRETDFEEALVYLKSSPEVEEIILSGGDPLVWKDRRLARLARELESIDHLRRLRIHTRLPVVLPQRIDEDLLAWLTESRLEPVVVIHTNHPREIDGEVASALRRLRRAGITLLNQTVLLRGINDSSSILSDLSKDLFAVGVLPYYLHLVDRVRGAAHFEIHEDEARALARELMAELPGYLVPRLVREVPGAPSKVPVDLRVGASSTSIS